MDRMNDGCDYRLLAVPRNYGLPATLSARKTWKTRYLPSHLSRRLFGVEGANAGFSPLGMGNSLPFLTSATAKRYCVCGCESIPAAQNRVV
ncbi:hypothetical protein MIND_01420200 [Mycena indigotica]|uniref:Uncharacterized protein n=1 Tax=Mycena indigotica TaxID=2126181 RepID=A0A8H6RXK8_9AGAR|nr:uncharacterized protein MIND_01420200 [Mycena indigotica]KAF7288748.1 hypothetical protein MIND_01420200 [Mycena indigotica]